MTRTRRNQLADIGRTACDGRGTDLHDEKGAPATLILFCAVD